MQEHPSNEQRIFVLEKKVAELERKAREQEARDIALLARVDGSIDDLRRIERYQMRSFDELKAGQQEQAARIDRIETRVGRIETRIDGVEQNIEVLVDTAKDHKTAIEQVAQGVSTILSIVRDASGPHQKLND